MNKKEFYNNFINDKENIINIETIFQKCYFETGIIDEIDAKIFIYYATAFFMCELLDDNNINITSSEIVSDEQVKKGLNFNNTVAAITKFNKQYSVEYSNKLIKCIQDKNIIGFLYVLTIIGHEIFHIYQYQCVENEILKPDCLIDALEYVKREIDEKFYEKNYPFLHSEISADLAGIYLTIGFIENIIGRKLTNNEKKEINYIFIEKSNKNLKIYRDNEEIYNYINSLIEDIKDYTANNLELLNKYPILKHIFNSNGNVRQLDEIINNYEILSSFYNEKNDLRRLYITIIKSISLDNKIKKYS